jgi:8-amino-7-oxononanoate synthase
VTTVRAGFDQLAADLEARRREMLWRERRVLDSAQGIHVRIDGRELLAFCSNDYLGLANDPRVIAALQQGAARYGVGSGASHLVCGHLRPHHELEDALAEFTGREAALLFSSGYAANLGVIHALVGKGDAVFEDRLNHASLLDGGLSSGARFQRFRHVDVGHLDALLARSSAVRKLVVIDGVFSMDGDEAPLTEMALCCRRHAAWLYVDDAHGFGVLGARGAGSLDKRHVGAAEVPLLMATLGKSLGCAGAFVAGSRIAIDTLVQFARTYIYTTALSPALSAAALESLRIVREEGWRRDRLALLIARLRAGLESLGFQLTESATAIQPVVLGDAGTALAAAAHLEREGIWVPAIRPPTVPRGSARLRITLSALHTQAQVDRLLEALSGFASSGRQCA